MKIITALVLVPWLFASNKLVAQTALKADSKKWTVVNCKAAFSKDTIHLINTSGRTAFLWAKNVSFKSGIIELDIKGKDKRGESFVGVAFQALDHETYQSIYFRPFNFRDPEKKDRAVQYISKPNYDWDLLREKHPGKYEHAILPDTNPNDWFHVKVVILYPSITVFVNGSNEPTLEVEQLGENKDGLLGLWIDSEEGWFKNVTLTKF
ncbi:hypothetical protein BH10BAC4_BH10BAC4_18060 [soil metagenome]